MVSIAKLYQEAIIGSEFILRGAIIVIILSIVTFIAFKHNRNKKSILTYLLILLITIELCDFIWLSHLFPDGEYFNSGLIGAYSFLILPVFLIGLNIFLTVRNKYRFK